MANLSQNNVIVVSAAAAPKGVSAFNTGNIAIFTHEVPGEDFGTDPYKIYLSAGEVITDFGSGSATADMANSAFSQSPNLLTSGGYLAVIPQNPAGVKITFSNVPNAGAVALYYGTDTSKVSSSINYNATASDFQTALRTIPALAKCTVAGDWTDGFTVSTPGDLNPSLAISSNTLNLSDDDTTITFTAQAVETVGEAITRTADLIAYLGVTATRILDQAELLSTAAVIQAQYKIGYFPVRAVADVESGGKADLIRSGNFTKTRALYYGLSDRGALLFSAAYASRGQSVNFSGSDTTITMNLKDLATVPVDTTVTQTIFNKCKICGADLYGSLEGNGKVFSFGANSYYDQVLNLVWILTKLQEVAVNYLATTSTKVPQTENGVAGMLNVIRKVCQQAVVNGYVAPGEWTRSDTFGDPETFRQNIRQYGFYVFSNPISSQTAAERESRQLPICMTAIKESGAVHSGSILIYVNS